MTPSDIARALGRLGGLARARRLTSAERKRIASAGGRARHESLKVERRIEANVAYAAAMRELRGEPSVKRVQTCRAPLPSITRPR